jgi:hypothetical protein
LIFYRNRELELRQAVQSPTWLQMRSLPGVTNSTAFHSKYASRMQSVLNLKQISVGFLRDGVGSLGRAAEAETRRRLVITAIALARYRKQHGTYPKSLMELVPEFLKKSPIDFMDGKPLRYWLTDDGHFILYSVGLDCVDDGGVMPGIRPRGSAYPGFGVFGIKPGTDLIWPRPALKSQVNAPY